MHIRLPAKVSQTSLFVVTLVLGIVFILIGKWHVALYPYFGILLPFILMISYAIYNVRNEFLDSTRAQVADNCYFLGFLYFLASLAVTLAQVSSGIGPDAKIEVAPIIQGFGVALVTTITGLFLRIILLQNIAGLSSAREKAEENLFNAVSRFHDQVSTSLDLLGTTRDDIIRTARATFEVTNQTLRDLAETSKLTTESATAGYLAGLSNASKKTSQELASIVEGLRLKVAEMALPADILVAQIKPSVDELRVVIQAINVEVAALAGGVAENAGHVRKIGPRLAKLADSFGQQTQVWEEAQARLVAQLAPIAELGQRLVNASDAAGRLADELERRLGALKQTPVAGQAALESLNQVVASVNALQDALGAVLRSLDAQVNAVAVGVSQAQSGTEQLLSTANAATASVDADLRRLAQSVETIQRGINRT